MKQATVEKIGDAVVEHRQNVFNVLGRMRAGMTDEGDALFMANTLRALAVMAGEHVMAGDFERWATQPPDRRGSLEELPEDGLQGLSIEPSILLQEQAG